MSSTAVLLIAHGSRRAEANNDLVDLARLITERALYDFVQVSYLELAPPSVPDAAKICVERGITRVLMLPYFLSEGMHVSRDLEGFREQFSKQYPQVEFVLCAPLGLHPLMADIVLDRLEQGSRSDTDNKSR